MELTAADIAYWPAVPRMKSMRPAIAERLDYPGVEFRGGLDWDPGFFILLCMLILVFSHRMEPLD